MNNKIFNTADILLPNVCDKTAFCVVACDQYTSEPLYWQEVKQIAGDKPSALNMVFPEIFLKTAPFDETISSINNTIQQYLENDVFKQVDNCLIYVRRKLKNGTVRNGIVGIIDLEYYDYTTGSQTAIRATEGTVLDRIPPRVKIRQDALLELPHVMLLIDDINKTVIEPLADNINSFQKAYDFPLMQNSGELSGYILDDASVQRIDTALTALASKQDFNTKYGTDNKSVLLFAVGDGNHSLATAKSFYLNIKEKLGCDVAAAHPARYALVEVVNLHDSSLQFEAIHRVVFDVAAGDLMNELSNYYSISDYATEGAQKITVIIGDTAKDIYIANPTLNLAVGSLQVFIDHYLSTHSGEVDYIHGEDVVKSICKTQKNCIGFILPKMDKNDLFKTVILDGALPRKTFSMGEAYDKRFYYEARRIK